MIEFRYNTRLKRADIALVMKNIRMITKDTHQRASFVIGKDYTKAFKKMKARTMVATGQLRDSAFLDSRVHPKGNSWSMGYGQTANQQAVSQEFDAGNVHRTVQQHFTDEGIPKCSRLPEDLYRKYGHYTANPSATRRAMAKSIENVFNTNVSSAVKFGGNLYYRPSFMNYLDDINSSLALYFHARGYTR